MTMPKLNRQLTLEAPQDIADGSGGFDRLWLPIGQHWAEVTPRTGRESTRGVAPTGHVSVHIKVRGAAIGHQARPRPEQRFRDGTRIYHIQSVTEADANGHYLLCTAEEEVVA